MTVANASAQETGSAEVYTSADTARARVLAEEGKKMFKERKYDIALTNAAQAQKIYTQVLGANTKEVVDIRETMGIIYANQGKYAEAAKMQETFSYNEVGAALLNLGEYQQAFSNFQNSLQLRQKLFGEDHVDVATSYMNIGVNLNYLGEYDNALKNLRTCLKIRTKLLSENHPDNGACFNNMGLSFTYKGDYDRAIEHFNKALEVRSKVLGAEHPASTTSN